MGIVLALALLAPAVAPVVGLQSDGAPPCDTSAFARDLRTLRPELVIVPLDLERAPPDAWIVRLEGVSTGQAALRVSGNSTPVVRPVSGKDCQRIVELAASIVDGMLDQLPRQAAASMGSLVPLRTSLGMWLGPGTLQGPIHWVPSVALGLRFSLGDWEIVGAADLGVLSTLSLSTEIFGRVGDYKALPFDLEIGGGYSPHLGPGNLSLDVLTGPSVAHVWIKGSPLSRADAWTVEAFVALAAGYTIDVVARFFLGVRVEERWAPTQARFEVEGSNDRVLTRTWTFTSTFLAGWRFF